MRKYDQEFSKETGKKYLNGQAAASIARKIGVDTTYKWKSDIIQKNGKLELGGKLAVKPFGKGRVSIGVR